MAMRRASVVPRLRSLMGSVPVSVQVAYGVATSPDSRPTRTRTPRLEGWLPRFQSNRSCIHALMPPLRPHLPVEHPVVNRLAHVRALRSRSPRRGRRWCGHAQHFVVGAGGEAQFRARWPSSGSCWRRPACNAVANWRFDICGFNALWFRQTAHAGPHAPRSLARASESCVVPAVVADNFRYGTAGTSRCKSIRSRSGPDDLGHVPFDLRHRAMALLRGSFR